MMKRFFILSSLLMVSILPICSQINTDLFFSEYVEGSSSNKYIEIFNGTGADVDLSGYQLLLFSNGAGSASITNNLTGTIANGCVVVLRHGSSTIYQGQSIPATALNFNGDDAIALKNVSTGLFVDIIGQIGADPGDYWGTGTLTTQNRTLVRKSSIMHGVSVNPTDGFSALESEWESYDVDDVGFLGNHQFNWRLTVSIPVRQVSVPKATEDLEISATVSGGTSPYSVCLKYSVNDGGEKTLAMTNTQGTTFGATIPAQPNGAALMYRVEAMDATSTLASSVSSGLFWGTSPLSSAANCLKELNDENKPRFLGYYARIEAVTTTGSSTFVSDNLEIYLQDGQGGICLYKQGLPEFPIESSRLLTIVGCIGFVEGKVVVTPDSYSCIVDNGAAAEVEPLEKTIDGLLAQAEDFKSMVVTVSSLSPTAGTWASNSFLTMAQPASTNSIAMRIDPSAAGEPVWPQTVAGIFTKDETDVSVTGGYVLMPRSVNDFGLITSSTGVVRSVNVIRCEGRKVVVDCPLGSSVTVFSMAGNQIASRCSEGGLCEISLFRGGVYLVRVLSANVAICKKVVVE